LSRTITRIVLRGSALGSCDMALTAGCAADLPQNPPINRLQPVAENQSGIWGSKGNALNCTDFARIQARKASFCCC
jgi:hypothetical protein